MPVGVDHLRFRAVAADGRALDAIAFRAAGKPLGQGLRALQGGFAHVVGALTLDGYGGRERVRLRVYRRGGGADVSARRR